MIKIFAVDDDLHLLETIIVQIEQEGGYDIEGASSLKEAKAKLADVDPDLVILDVTLGDGDGRDFCRWMRDMGYTIPVLMLTAQSSEMDTIEHPHHEVCPRHIPPVLTQFRGHDGVRFELPVTCTGTFHIGVVVGVFSK